MVYGCCGTGRAAAFPCGAGRSAPPRGRGGQGGVHPGGSVHGARCLAAGGVSVGQRLRPQGKPGTESRQAGPAPGRAEGPRPTTAGPAAPSGHRQASRPGGPARAGVDPPAGTGSGAPLVRHRPVAGDHRQVLALLGAVAAEADPAGLRAGPRGGSPLAGAGVPGHRRPGQEGQSDHPVAGPDRAALRRGGGHHLGTGRPDPGGGQDRQTIRGST